MLLECFVSNRDQNPYTKELSTFLMKMYTKFNPADSSREQLIYNSMALLYKL